MTYSETSISKEVVIGFDARVVANQVTELATIARRLHEWVLRPELKSIMSIDASVWPSVTRYQQHLGENAWIGFVQDLWENLDSLLAFLSDHKPTEAFLVVGFSLVRSECSVADYSLWSEVLLPTSPDSLDDSTWFPVGYDVADRFLQSALANCLHCSQPEFVTLQSQFVARINEHHLFDVLGDAEEFRRVVNSFIPDHAPFFIYRIYVRQSRIGG
jgi:hypothetical protein